MGTPPALAGFAAMVAIFFALATAALGLRLWVRRTITHSIASDDYTLIASHLTNAAAGGVWLYYHITGARFAPDSQELASWISMVSPMNACLLVMTNSMQPEVIATALVLTASAFNKSSVASFFLRIAHQRWQRWAIVTPLSMYVLTLVITLLIIIFRCGLPINGTRIITATDCPIPRTIFNTLGAIIATVNTLCDWSFAFVPMYMVWTATRMDRMSKISAGVLIILAVSGSFISFARVPFFARGESFEPTTVYKTAPILLLSVVENFVGVAVISVATLKPLLGVMRNGSISRRPSLPVAGQPNRMALESEGGGEMRSDSRHYTPDWSFMRGIGILPDIGMGRTIRYADEEAHLDEIPKTHAKVTVKVTHMASIDEVVHSAADSETRVTSSEGTNTTWSTAEKPLAK